LSIITRSVSLTDHYYLTDQY